MEEGRGKRNEGSAWQLGNRPKMVGVRRAGVQITVFPRCMQIGVSELSLKLKDEVIM